MGDYLGRSLRENVSIFKIDVEEKTVCFVTESNKVVAGTYEIDKRLALHDIVVEDVSEFTDENKFESLVNSKISGFVKNIYEDSHKKAKSSFDDLLYLWESRLKFKNIKNKLEEKSLKFNESTEKPVPLLFFNKYIGISSSLQLPHPAPSIPVNKNASIYPSLSKSPLIISSAKMRLLFIVTELSITKLVPLFL